MDSYQEMFQSAGFSDKSEIIQLLYNQYFVIYIIFLAVFEGFTTFGYGYYIAFSFNALFLVIEIILYIHLKTFNPSNQNMELRCKTANITLNVFFNLSIVITIANIIICKDKIAYGDNFDKFFMVLYYILAVVKIVLIKFQHIINAKLFKGDE